MSRLTLLVTLLLLSLGCSRPAPPIVVEDRAVEIVETDVAFVERLGGSVTRDEDAPDKPVIAVSLVFKNLTDAGLKKLAGLKNLTKLHLGGTQVTDAGVE